MRVETLEHYSTDFDTFDRFLHPMLFAHDFAGSGVPGGAPVDLLKKIVDFQASQEKGDK